MRRLKFKGNTNSAEQKKLKECNQFSLGELPARKLFCKFHTTTKRSEIESRIVMSSQITVYTSTRIFVRSFRVNEVEAIDCVLIPLTTGFGRLVVLGLTSH